MAYTLGEELNSSAFCTHIEKAYASVRGYPTVNREFAANMLANYKFINREDDTGSGLRKAKLSYYPEILLQKYRAFYKDKLWKFGFLLRSTKKKMYSLWQSCFGDDGETIDVFQKQLFL